MPDHCPACAAHREITAHRDEHTPEWGPKRAAQHQGNPGPVTTYHDTEAAAEDEAERRVRAGVACVVVFAVEMEDA